MNSDFKKTIEVCSNIQRKSMEGARDAARLIGAVSLEVPNEQLPDSMADMHAKFKPLRVALENATTAADMLDLVRAEIEAIEQGALPFQLREGGGEAAGTADKGTTEAGDDDDADDTTRQERAVTDNEPARGPRKKKLRKMSTRSKGYRMERV